MNKILTILLLGSVALTAAPKLEIKLVKQKVVEATGKKYGSLGGIYFKYTGLDPFIMYGLEYSQDMKTWTHLYNLVLLEIIQPVHYLIGLHFLQVIVSSE